MRRSDPHLAARVGLWLGVAFGLCFATGLLSHAAQHPPGWFTWPTRPVSLYRITQGVHVVSGVAAIPLLLAKLHTVYPRLFQRPVVGSVRHALERGSVLVLVGAAFFELVTGLFNAAQNYPWGFFFPPAHYAVAWVAVGALLVHVAVKLPLWRAAPEPRRATLSRRGFLLTTGGAVAVAVLATAGASVPWLRRVSVLATRSAALPVNRTAAAAGVRRVGDGWRLRVGAREFSLAELAALPQTSAELPIACVEGWSASARWTGVPVRDLLALAGLPVGDVRVESLERDGLYRASTLPAAHAEDPLTLLALRLDGAPLPLDHGYPCRLIAPSRPGVLQTKWVTSLEVR
ncbi:DMSO/TMAO reductase YedYZ molybdopterin-dependent catalytic subunit [Saccharothrix coeruleofusca]|uniref:molybdopterin-dependent oxidoreductase n=1 Tax=Saccharothrix coeruleofusca TaxID=33919 RepID=UPI001AE31364|nr:molybdopterin-dependent oxidoreductase [Saccharothrix coeruleofusca]MBP2340713.1 DMSO/TMAO reductase YedYZ molybdopterin-dependent catalytic subunit [Saccharothrix coeruleofusca]